MPDTASQTGFFLTDSPRRAGLVLNPASLRNAQNPEMTQAIIDAFSMLGESFLIGRGNDLDMTLNRWKDEDLDLLAISGGDGTAQRVIDQLLSIWGDVRPPRLLLIHGGTAGIVAKETGNIDPIATLESLGNSRNKGQMIPAEILHTLRVDNRITLSFGVGVFRNLSAEYVTYGGWARLSHLLLGARFLGSFFTSGELARRTLLPVPYQIRIGDELFPSHHFVGLFASGLRKLEVFRPYREVSCPEDGFKVVGIQTIKRRTFIRGIRPILKGDNERIPEQLLLCGTQRLELLSAGEPISYIADGEFYTGDMSVTVEPGPELTVLRPDRNF